WQSPMLRFRVTCGSGTYIRSLARDLGETLGCGAHLTALRREWVEPFLEPSMHTLDTLKTLSLEQLDQLLLPVDAGLASLPAVHLDARASRALQHGQRVSGGDMPDGQCRAYAPDGRLLALAERRADGNLHVLRGFNLPENAQNGA